MTAYYNEYEPYAAQWLENLIREGLIAHGVVDRRSIRDVRAADVSGFTQCHFFAGMGGWSLALRLAGWPDDNPVWTGSCPCQPFSAAGKRKGVRDDRHLWPVFARLIGDAKPTTVFGEQVASADGRQWLANVRDDLAAMGYAVGAADLCAASVGAPHIRQRLWFGAQRLGDPNGGRCDGRQGHAEHDGSSPGRPQSECVAERPGRSVGGVEYPDRDGCETRDVDAPPAGYGHPVEPTSRGMGDATCARSQRQRRIESAGSARDIGLSRPPSCYGFWDAATWAECGDGKTRPTQPGVSPLAHGVPGRVGRVRAAGNAIVPQVAAGFVTAFWECLP